MNGAEIGILAQEFTYNLSGISGNPGNPVKLNP